MAFIPPVGTSAYKAYNYQQATFRSPTWDGLQNIKSLLTRKEPAYAQSGPMSENGNPSTIASSAIKDYKSVLKSGLSSASSFAGGSSSGSSGGGFSSSGGSVASPALDYYQAALASHYGMDAPTAYQEALANTSYQRSVQDILNAGLNPASLFAAGRVSGANGVGYAAQIGSGFAGSGSSGGGSAKSKNLFSKEFYTAMQVVGGGLAVAVTKNPFTYPIGASAAKGVMQVVNGFFG